MHVLDCDAAGFEWIDCCDAESTVISLLRKSGSPNDTLAIVCNFTPLPRYNYQVGVPQGGFWQEVLNSDAPLYGGGGQGNFGGVEAVPVPCHGRDYMLTVTVPPLGLVAFKRRA
jgi:1,4-alpha-glucan branching enzyme